MKKVAFAVAIACLGSTAFAGTIEPPVMVMEPTVIVEEVQQTTGSSMGSAGSNGYVLPLLILGLLVGAATCCK